MEIKYDTPIEVSKAQHDALMTNLPGIVAGRFDKKENKHYIKVWMTGYNVYVQQILNSVN